MHSEQADSWQRGNLNLVQYQQWSVISCVVFKNGVAETGCLSL